MELNSILFFKTKFDIATKVSGGDPLQQLVSNIKQWMLSKYGREAKARELRGILSSREEPWRQFARGGRIFSADRAKTLFMESEYVRVEDTAEELWACQLVENQPTRLGFAPRKWITEIGYEGREAGKATISLVLSYTDVPGFLGPCEKAPDASVPRLIRLLLEDPALVCSIVGQAVRIDAFQLQPGDFEWFYKFLLSPEREIPVVYISPAQDGQDGGLGKLWLSPDKLAKQVATNALIYYARYPDANEEMRYYCDWRYQCCDGTVRLYMPRPDLNDRGDSSRHRYFTVDQLNEFGEEQILSIFRRVLAQDVHFYETMFCLDECRQKKRGEISRRSLEAIRVRSKESIQQTQEEMKNTIEELEGVVKLTEKERDDIKEELKRALEQNHDLNDRLAYWRSDAAKAQELESALKGVRTLGEYPKGPKAIGSYFEMLYGDRLAFSDDGRKSLDDCITKDEILWEALFYMATTLYDLYTDDRVTQIDKEFKVRTGWDLARGEGAMTRKDSTLMKQYVTLYDGREIDIESHIKSGTSDSDSKFIRIYFGYDGVSNKLIIGQCGRHKKNYSTSKRR